VDQTRDIAAAVEQPLSSPASTPWFDKPVEDPEVRIAAFEERFANWGTD